MHFLGIEPRAPLVLTSPSHQETVGLPGFDAHHCYPGSNDLKHQFIGLLLLAQMDSERDHEMI